MTVSCLTVFSLPLAFASFFRDSVSVSLLVLVGLCVVASSLSTETLLEAVPNDNFCCPASSLGFFLGFDIVYFRYGKGKVLQCRLRDVNNGSNIPCIVGKIVICFIYYYAQSVLNRIKSTLCKRYAFKLALGRRDKVSNESRFG